MREPTTRRLTVPRGTALAIALATAALGAACYGGGGGPSIPPAGLLTPAADETPPGTVSIFGEAAASPGPDLEGATSLLVELLNRGLAGTYRVRYETRTPDGAAGDGYAIYIRPPLTRIDTFVPNGTEPVSLIIARGGGLTVNCSRAAGQWNCFKIESFGDPLLTTAGPVVYPTLADLRQSQTTEVSGRNVAGEQSRCFRVASFRGVLEYCLRDDGALLYASGTGGTVEATSVSPEVADTDFTLPAEAEPAD